MVFSQLIIILFLLSFNAECQSPANHHLTQVVEHLQNKIPYLIHRAKNAIQKGLKIYNVKKWSQSTGLLVGSWNDVISVVLKDNETLSRVSLRTYRYAAYLGVYGVAYSLPGYYAMVEDRLDCGPDDFLRILDQSRTSHNLLTMSMPTTKVQLENGLSCILKHTQSHQEAAEVEWALEEYLAAIQIITSQR